MDTSCYFAAVTGQPFHSTKEYYDLICSPKASTALLQLALFTSKSSKCSNTEQHEPPQQRQGIAKSSANQAVGTVTLEAQQPQHELHNGPESQLLISKEPGGVNKQSTNAAAVAAPAAAPAAGSVGPSADMPAAAAAAAALTDTPAKSDDAEYPVLTGSLLDFSIWNCRPVAAGAARALHPADVNSCSGAAAAAAAAIYNEPVWLQDLHAMKAEALQHL